MVWVYSPANEFLHFIDSLVSTIGSYMPPVHCICVSIDVWIWKRAAILALVYCNHMMECKSIWFEEVHELNRKTISNEKHLNVILCPFLLCVLLEAIECRKLFMQFHFNSEIRYDRLRHCQVTCDEMEFGVNESSHCVFFEFEMNKIRWNRMKLWNCSTGTSKNTWSKDDTRSARLNFEITHFHEKRSFLLDRVMCTNRSWYILTFETR